MECISSKNNVNVGKKFSEFTNLDFELTLKDSLAETEVADVLVDMSSPKFFEEIVKYFQPGEDDIGVVIGIGSRLVSLDVFSSNKHLKDYLPRLIRSVALDSFKKTGYKTFLKTTDVYKFLKLIERSDKRIYDGTAGSLGNYLRFNDNLITGALLTLEQKTIHFYASLKELSTPPDFKSKVA